MCLIGVVQYESTGFIAHRFGGLERIPTHARTPYHGNHRDHRDCDSSTLSGFSGRINSVACLESGRYLVCLQDTLIGWTEVG